MFAKILGVDYDKPDVLDTLNESVRVVQGVIKNFEGTVLRLLADDKGTRFKIVFGMPGPWIHCPVLLSVLTRRPRSDARRRRVAMYSGGSGDYKAAAGALQYASGHWAVGGDRLLRRSGKLRSLRVHSCWVPCQPRRPPHAAGIAAGEGTSCTAHRRGRRCCLKALSQGILCSAELFTVAKRQAVVFENCGDVTVKGLSHPITVYRPLGLSSDPNIAIYIKVRGCDGTRWPVSGMTSRGRDSASTSVTLERAHMAAEPLCRKVQSSIDCPKGQRG